MLELEQQDAPPMIMSVSRWATDVEQRVLMLS